MSTEPVYVNVSANHQLPSRSALYPPAVPSPLSRCGFVTRAKDFETVRCTEELVVIPTYPVQEADPNPMFFEKRVYQGSSGKVDPNPFTDRVSLEKKDATYRVIFLENEFIQLMILPEIGGRIHCGLDKTNQDDLFYRPKR